MLGYRDYRVHAGLFSARLDDVLNYLPTRLAVVPMMLGFYITSGKAACAKAWIVLKRDRHKKRAINSGIPLALFAGGLGVTLIKPLNYEIGEGKGDITRTTVTRHALHVDVYLRTHGRFVGRTNNDVAHCDCRYVAQ
jgi:cobalamin biosynthesis protein CobD/CbiB